MGSSMSVVGRHLPRAMAAAFVLLLAFPAIGAQDVPASKSAVFTPEAVPASVMEIAAIVSREYFDPTIADRLANSLRRRLHEGEYTSVTSADALAEQVTRDLLAASRDKHLAVTVIGEAAPSPGPASPDSRADGVRRTNGGVQRVEILPGNVGYFKLTKRVTGVGRRIFRIAPVHHHVEHLGWDEVNVVIRFWVIAGIFVVTGLGIFYTAWLN